MLQVRAEGDINTTSNGNVNATSIVPTLESLIPALVYNATNSSEISSFDLPAWVTPINNVPRIIGSTDPLETSQFLKGLIFIAAVWIICACAIVICLPVPACCMRCTKKRYPEAAKRGNCVKFMYTALFLVLFTGCALMLAGSVETTSGVDSIVDAVQGVLRLGIRALSDVQEITQAGAELSTASDEIAAACVNDTAVQNALNNVTAWVSQAAASLASLRLISPDQISSMQDTVDSLQTARTIGKALVYGITAVTLLLAILLAVFATLGFALQKSDRRAKHFRRTARCGQCCLIPLTLILLFVSMLLTGVYLATDAGIAGVCILPNNYVPEIVGVLESQAVASFALRCQGPDVSVLTTVGNATTNFINTVSTSLTELNAARDPGSTCAQVRQEYWNELVSSLQTGLTLSINLIVNVLNLLACTNVQQFYVLGVYSGLCREVGFGFLLTWIGYCLASGSLIAIVAVMLYVASPFRRPPPAKHAEDGGDGAAKDIDSSAVDTDALADAGQGADHTDESDVFTTGSLPPASDADALGLKGKKRGEAGSHFPSIDVELPSPSFPL